MSEQAELALSRAAVIGAGTMGLGIAQVLALRGVSCAIVDRTAAESAAAQSRAQRLAASFVEAGLWPDTAVELVAQNVRAAELEDAVADAELVVEAVPEDPELKHTVLRRIEAATADEALIVTNTSAIPIALLGQALERRRRFLGWHWFNPAQWVPCVEVIPTADTDERCVEFSLRVLAWLGKSPARVADSAGFVANRIQFAMFKEAVAVVADGVADAETVDAVVRTSFGFRLPFYGPFTIADMAGLDVYAGAYAALERDLGAAFAAPEAMTELVRAGRLGTKTGAGFRDWGPEQVEELRSERDRRYSALGRLLEETERPPR